ncbi:hypothetical protein [Facklamia hominis]|nr:hypothetical protein [Facklamia hominis]WPJ90961.1 hypothetical protein R0V13_00760 [Facklamia hominis]
MDRIKKERKKIMKKGIIKNAFLAVSLFGLLGTSMVSANNHQDTGFSFDLKFRNTKYTEPRAKTDASSSYASITSLSNARSINCFIVGPGGENVNSSTVVLAPGQADFIHQYTYEWNYRSCKLGVRKNGGWDNVHVTGVWSPDCIYCN